MMINVQHDKGLCLQSTCKNRWDAYACVFRMVSLPVPSEKNVPSAISRPIPCLWPPGPSLAMLPASEYRSRTRRERFFRTAKPVPYSALLVINIASFGGAGVRYDEDGGDVFFARDGLGCDGVALLSLCACVRMLCGAWLVLSLLGTACTNMGRVVLYILSSTLRYYLLSTPIGPIVALGW